MEEQYKIVVGGSKKLFASQVRIHITDESKEFMERAVMMMCAPYLPATQRTSHSYFSDMLTDMLYFE